LRIAGIASLAGLAIGTLGAAALRHSGERVKRVLLAFVTMTGNFSGVPLAFAFIIILGINGAVTLLLKSWGLIDGFNLYSGSGLILIYTYFQIPLALLLLYPAFDALQDEWPQAAARREQGQYVWHVALPVLTPAPARHPDHPVCQRGGGLCLRLRPHHRQLQPGDHPGGQSGLRRHLPRAESRGGAGGDPDGAAGVVTAANQWLLKKSYVNKGQSHA
jgi:putative spermidine/putrescine transport system permease protein